MSPISKWTMKSVSLFNNTRFICAAVLLTALVFVGYTFFKISGTTKEGYQAVFLNNNQVYFGQLKWGWGKTAILKDVFYLRMTQDLQSQSNGAEQSDLQLVKLGGEVHGPKDALFMPKYNILFWENLKNDSKVVMGIKQYHETSKK